MFGGDLGNWLTNQKMSCIYLFYNDIIQCFVKGDVSLLLKIFLKVIEQHNVSIAKLNIYSAISLAINVNSQILRETRTAPYCPL